jgi:hypothetical protein
MLDPAHLPARTVFYFLWRGTPVTDARNPNHLLSLWNDPDFAPVRSGLFASLAAASSTSGSASSLSLQELTEYSTLLDNPFIIGFLAEPKGHRTAKETAKPSVTASAPDSWNGVFFIYDRSGKETLLAKALLRMRAQQKEIPKLTPLTIAGVSALKVETKSDTTYWAETGNFAVSAKERSVFVEILTRLTGKSAPAASLAQNPYYQEAQPLLGTGAIEVFLRVADLRDIIETSNPSGAKAAMALDAIKLNAFHSLAFHFSFDGPKTRIQGALLGDTSGGTLFDIFADGLASPASLAYLSPDTIHYQETQLNLLGIYNTARRVVASTLPPNQAGGADMLEAMASQRLGMPLKDALALPTGEIGSLQSSPALDPAKQIYFIGIQNKSDTLKLLRSILAERIASELNDGPVTYVKLSLQANQTNAGVAQWHFYYLAITPNMIFAAAQKEILQNLLAYREHTASIAASPALLAARAQFPEKLSSFSYFDFKKLDWPAVKEKSVAMWANFSKNQPPNVKSTPTQEPPAWLTHFDLQVLSRHLHSSSSASWKDSKGVHFDSWLD